MVESRLCHRPSTLVPAPSRLMTTLPDHPTAAPEQHQSTMANAWQAARARLAHPLRLVGEAGWIYPFWVCEAPASPAVAAYAS